MTPATETPATDATAAQFAQLEALNPEGAVLLEAVPGDAGADFLVRHLNPVAERTLALAPEAWRGRRASELVVPRRWAALRAVLARALEARAPEALEVRKSGASTRLALRVVPAGEGLVVLRFADVTQAHQAQVRLRESEARYRSLAEASAQVVWRTDATGGLQDSPSWYAFSGQTPEQAAGWGWLDAFHPNSRDLVLHRFRDAMGAPVALPQEGEVRIRRRDGVWRRVLVRAVPVFGPDGRVREWMGTHQDVTEQRATERALRESEARLRALGDASFDALMLHERGRILEVNPGCTELLGVPAEGLVGHHVLELGIVAPESVPIVRASIDAGTWSPDEVQLRHAQGHTFRAAVRGRTVSYQGRPVRAVTLRDATAEHALEARRRAVLEHEQAARELAEAMVHERTRELQAARELLIQREKLATAGHLAAGVAHEINNPLAFVMGNLEYLRTRLGGGGSLPAAELAELLDEAHAGAERIRRIVRDLRTFSRADDEDVVEPVDARGALEFSLSMAMTEIRHRAQLERDFAPDVPAVWGQDTRLGQVFLNLLLNAAQAIPMGDAARHRVRVGLRRHAAGEVAVEVQDTGSGMTPEVQRRIFDPFFTTKPVGEGTGLGLSLCHGIVQRLGGRIEVESTPGEGSLFRVVLRVADEDVAPRPDAAHPAPAAPAGARPRLLVVDDERDVSLMLARCLQDQLDVDVVHSGREALARLEAGPVYDAVLCDLMMPEMSGMELHDVLAARRPQLLERFIFMTGGGFTELARRFLASARQPVLEKPFSPSVVGTLVEKLTRMSP